MTRLVNPYPLYLDAYGVLLDGGQLFIGEAGADPEVNPINVYRDMAMTQQLAQPLRTLGGYIVDGLTPCFVYYAENDASMRLRDANGAQIWYIANSAESAVAYQPLDSDLTAISNLATTPFGRGLLTLANQAALQSAVGLPDAMPKVGGTFTGQILRQGAGGYAYAASSDYPAVRFFFTDSDASDPTSQAGDVWIKLAPA